MELSLLQQTPPLSIAAELVLLEKTYLLLQKSFPFSCAALEVQRNKRYFRSRAVELALLRNSTVELALLIKSAVELALLRNSAVELALLRNNAVELALLRNSAVELAQLQWTSQFSSAAKI